MNTITSIGNSFTAILNQKYDPHFPLQHQQKDLRLALQLGDKVEQPLYITAAANEVFICLLYFPQQSGWQVYWNRLDFVSLSIDSNLYDK